MEEKILKEGMNWYAVRTMNNVENKVKERIIKEVESNNLTNLVSQIMIPTEKVVSSKNGKKVLKERALYPGYIFIETSAIGEMARILKGIDGTPGFVRTRDGSITPMKKREIDQIIESQKITDEKKISDIYTIGEEVVVIDGAFSSFKGIIQKIDQEKEKVKLDVYIFGRSTPVDLTFSQIRKND
jgi:transcriptional antiterminator NusG